MHRQGIKNLKQIQYLIIFSIGLAPELINNSLSCICYTNEETLHNYISNKNESSLQEWRIFSKIKIV